MNRDDFQFEYVPHVHTRVERNGLPTSAIVLRRSGRNYYFHIYANFSYREGQTNTHWYLEFPANFCELCVDSNHPEMVDYVLRESQQLVYASYENRGQLK